MKRKYRVVKIDEETYCRVMEIKKNYSQYFGQQISFNKALQAYMDLKKHNKPGFELI
jgi:hypothetical protein